MKALCAVVLVMLAIGLAGAALGEYDAEQAQAWLNEFAGKISSLSPVNDVAATADPARPGEILLEYSFGTVAATSASAPRAGDILRIELTGDEMADVRGICVGATLEDVIGGRQIAGAASQLYVLSTQEAGTGWCWAYVGEQGVYGVEAITYGEAGGMMKEYTLTYVINEGRVTAIRMQIADATTAQAAEGLRTAEEIAMRQQGEVFIVPNDRTEFCAADMTVQGRQIVGMPVEALIAAVGEPHAVQSLPGGVGRMLVYEQMAAELIFDEMTGVEFVRAIGCADADVVGPRGLRVDMPLQETAALFRCDGEVTSLGGMLYLAGEAQDMPPYGEMIRGEAGQCTLRYACLTNNGALGVLEVVVTDGAVSYWRLAEEQKEAAYDG